MLVVMIAGALSAAACVNSQARLRAGLERAGLPSPMSQCVAERMVDRLSVLQLRRIGALGNLKNDPLPEMTVDRFLYNVRALRDPEILAVASTSAVLCSAVAVDRDHTAPED